MDNTNPSQQQNPQNPQYPPQYQPPFGQQPPAGGNPYLARINAFRRQRPVLAGVAALIAICVVCAACAGIVQGISGAGQTAGAQSNARISGPTATPKPTATATATPKPKVWTTVQTFTGNGIKKTGTFAVPDDWKLIWTCKPSSFYNGSYNLIVTVYNSDGSYADLAVNTICKSGNTSDTTEEHTGGQIYLDVNSEAYWQLQVQELK